MAILDVRRKYFNNKRTNRRRGKTKEKRRGKTTNIDAKFQSRILYEGYEQHDKQIQKIIEAPNKKPRDFSLGFSFCSIILSCDETTCLNCSGSKDCDVIHNDSHTLDWLNIGIKNTDLIIDDF